MSVFPTCMSVYHVHAVPGFWFVCFLFVEMPSHVAQVGQDLVILLPLLLLGLQVYAIHACDSGHRILS